MQYVVICQNRECGKRYAPVADQLEWIERAAREGYTFIMLRCQHCGHEMGFNPQLPEGYVEPQPTHLCCPVETCDGFVVLIPDHFDERRDSESVYGCGECGNTWTSKSDLDRAISTIIAKYPYRTGCYTKSASGWVPVEYDRLPKDYHDLIASEWEKVKK
jgi:hypothetical protein